MDELQEGVIQELAKRLAQHDGCSRFNSTDLILLDRVRQAQSEQHLPDKKFWDEVLGEQNATMAQLHEAVSKFFSDYFSAKGTSGAQNEDTARLDWLSSNGHIRGEDWFWRYFMDNAFAYEHGKMPDDLREAIDAARGVQPAAQEPNYEPSHPACRRCRANKEEIFHCAPDSVAHSPAQEKPEEKV